MKVVIEMPKGTTDKAEIDKETGTLRIDRKLHVKCPFNYGFIKDTLAEDGDALDVFVLGPELPGLTEIEVIPVGVFLCADQGVSDHKVLAVPYGDAYDDQALIDIMDYLTTYKPGFEVMEWTADTLYTLRVIRKTRIHRVKPIYQHETLGWKKFLGLFVLAGIIWLIDRLIK